MRLVQPADEAALPAFRLATILGTLATAALLVVVSATAGLGVAGWIAGLATGSVAAGLIAAARTRSDQPRMLAADWVTLTRAVLVAGVAGLVADSFSRPVSITALVTLSTVALVLDAVDGQVARRTGTATPLGGRLDSEVGAFLILLLSITVSRDYGDWVLAIGAARYVLLLAGWLIPWLASPLPPRYWREVVAAVQGIVLTVAASGVLGRLAGMIAVAAALLLLAESFGRDVIWLYRTGVSARTRQALLQLITVSSVVLMWGVLVAPDRIFQLTPAAFVRIPAECLGLVAVGLVLPARPRRIVAAVAGIMFGLLTLMKIFDMGFYAEIGRAFNPVFDWGAVYPAVGAVRDAIGARSTDAALVELILGFILVIAAITASAIHITTVAARHRHATVRGLAALTSVWALCAGLSLQLVPGTPLASASAARLAVAQVRGTQRMLREQHRFEIDLVSSHWPWAPLPTMVPWNKVGNGSIFDPMPARSESPTTVWSNASTVRQFFGRSIQYSLDALTSWVTELSDPNLVLILLGDEQPAGIISGDRANHVVPISIVARDPSVFRQIASWHWQDGLLPGPKAPLEPMDAFRNQFLGAFSAASS